MSSKIDRYEIAWRIWCWQQGYGKEENRKGLTNWMRDDNNQLHPNDIEARNALLPIADDVIALAKSENDRIPCGTTYASHDPRTNTYDMVHFGHATHECITPRPAMEPHNGGHICRCKLSWEPFTP